LYSILIFAIKATVPYYHCYGTAADIADVIAYTSHFKIPEIFAEAASLNVRFPLSSFLLLLLYLMLHLLHFSLLLLTLVEAVADV
jgi:hypothetical protein